MMLRPSSVAWLVLLAPVAAAGDEVVLRGGGKVTGVIVQRTDRSIVLETAPGRVAIPLARVEAVRETESELATYLDRVSRLGPDDAAGWVALARWAAERDLRTQSRHAYERVLGVQPDDPEANRALGRVRLNGRWVTEEEANRASGLVPFEGGWITPAEREAIQRDRAAELAEGRAAREAEARAREAEARAREAEARARAAEADPGEPAEGGNGIPLWPYVHGPVLVPPFHPFPPPTQPPPPPATDRPRPKPLTGRIGPAPAPPPPLVKTEGGRVNNPTR